MNRLTNCEWSDDCHSKQDYDGNLISVSTRLYPPAYQANGKYSAYCSILLDIKPDDYITLANTELEDSLECNLKLMVEEWVQEQSKRIVKALKTEFDFELED